MVLPCALPRTGLAETPASTSSQDLPQVLILGELERGAVLGDTPPLIQLGVPEIESFGVASVSELVDELAPETQSSRGRSDAQPVPLLNGRRISSWAEIGDIPSEAVERVEVFPEDLALKYGYSADQKVVNFIVQEHYRAFSADGEGDVTGTGDAAVAKGNLGLHQTHRGRAAQPRSVLRAGRDAAREPAWLRTVTAGSPFDLIGNRHGLPGREPAARLIPP